MFGVWCSFCILFIWQQHAAALQLTLIDCWFCSVRFIYFFVSIPCSPPCPAYLQVASYRLSHMARHASSACVQYMWTVEKVFFFCLCVRNHIPLWMGFRLVDWLCKASHLLCAVAGLQIRWRHSSLRQCILTPTAFPLLLELRQT